MAPTEHQELTQEDVDFFLANGWLKLTNCFTQAQSDRVCANLWTRLGMSPTDKSTWHTERTNMPAHTRFAAPEFAPKAWRAICDLLGGADRINAGSQEWGDGLIVNLGTPEGEGKAVGGAELTGWHVDGDFFVHYLDSAEQGLLVIPLFTDIEVGGGGTMLCPAAIPQIARHLHANTAGVSPRMTPRAQNTAMDPEPTLEFFNAIARSHPPEDFVEATGRVGDVYLLHPLMLHSASNNAKRHVRVITNPPVSLREPFCFDRPGGEGYSVVERKTLAELGMQGGLKGWAVTAGRDPVVPERLRKQARMKEEEEARLKELKRLDGLRGKGGVAAGGVSVQAVAT